MFCLISSVTLWIKFLASSAKTDTSLVTVKAKYLQSGSSGVMSMLSHWLMFSTLRCISAKTTHAQFEKLREQKCQLLACCIAKLRSVGHWTIICSHQRKTLRTRDCFVGEEKWCSLCIASLHMSSVSILARLFFWGDPWRQKSTIWNTKLFLSL